MDPVGKAVGANKCGGKPPWWERRKFRRKRFVTDVEKGRKKKKNNSSTQLGGNEGKELGGTPSAHAGQSVIEKLKKELGAPGRKISGKKRKGIEGPVTDGVRGTRKSVRVENRARGLLTRADSVVLSGAPGVLLTNDEFPKRWGGGGGGGG